MMLLYLNIFHINWRQLLCFIHKVWFQLKDPFLLVLKIGLYEHCKNDFSLQHMDS